MIEAIKIWNEPNNLSHWDFTIDAEWKEFSRMAALGAAAIREHAPHLKIVLGGISPIDPVFMGMLRNYGLLDSFDVVAVHGFPLDWNHWKLDEWPDQIASIEDASGKPVWVTEVGISTFGADEVQVFGLERTIELLADRVERVFWYSLMDLPPDWEATTRHKESEGSSYYRHYYMGLIRADGTPKPAFYRFDPRFGMAQWFHYEDHRLEEALDWLRKLGITRLRTGISWADWHRPDPLAWFDRQMAAVADFDVTLTLCFTPPSRGRRPCHTSPPLDPGEFAGFCREVVERYCPPPAEIQKSAEVW
ncbi:MAG: glycosyl hydrolase [Thermodesulfobacteriota bacterium]